MLEEIEIVERDFETKVKAIITDATSDCRKARSLVVEQLPHILSLDCFAHQVCFVLLVLLADAVSYSAFMKAYIYICSTACIQSCTPLYLSNSTF